MTKVLTKYKLPIKPGYNPKIKACRVTVDDLDFIHRPIIGYMGVFAFQAVGNSLLNLFGFQR